MWRKIFQLDKIFGEPEVTFPRKFLCIIFGTQKFELSQNCPKNKKDSQENLYKPLFLLVGRHGIEPWTY